MAGIASMRILVSGLVSLLALGGCATVSMAPASMVVTASVSEDQSEFRETCSDFSTAVYERGLVTKRDGVAQVFNMLAFGEKMEIEDTAYRDRVQLETAPASVVFKTVEADAKWTKAQLDNITDQVSALLGEIAADVDDKSLRKDIIAFEEALVLSKKARVSFLDVMGELDGQLTADFAGAKTAISELEASIDRAASYIEKLSDAYASIAEPLAAS